MSSASAQVITITGNYLRETAKAIHFQVLTAGEDTLEEPKEIWIPFSQVTKISKDPNTEDSDYLVVKRWILEKAEVI